MYFIYKELIYIQIENYISAIKSISNYTNTLFILFLNFTEKENISKIYSTEFINILL